MPSRLIEQALAKREAAKTPPPTGGSSTTHNVEPLRAESTQKLDAERTYLELKQAAFRDPVWAGEGQRRILGRMDKFSVPRITPFDALPFALFIGARKDEELLDVALAGMLAKTVALPAHVAPFVSYYNPQGPKKTLGFANEVVSILKHTDVGRGGGGLGFDHFGSTTSGGGGRFPRIVLSSTRGWEPEEATRSEETVINVWTMCILMGSVRFHTSARTSYWGKWFDLDAVGSSGPRSLAEGTKSRVFDPKDLTMKIPHDHACGSYLAASLSCQSLDLFSLLLRMFRFSDTFNPLEQCLGKAAGISNGKFLEELVRYFHPTEADLVKGGSAHAPLKIACETGLEEQVLNLLYNYVRKPEKVVKAKIFKIPNFSHQETLINVSIYYNHVSLVHRLISEICPDFIRGIQEESHVSQSVYEGGDESGMRMRTPIVSAFSAGETVEGKGKNDKKNLQPKSAIRRRGVGGRRRRYQRVSSDDDEQDSDAPPPTTDSDLDDGSDGDGSGRTSSSAEGDSDVDYGSSGNDDDDDYDDDYYADIWGSGQHKKYGSHPIDTAIESLAGPDLEMVKMLTTPVDVYYCPECPVTELELSYDPERTKELYQRKHRKGGLGLKVDHRDANGFTFLHKAAIKKSLPMVKLLLDVAKAQFEWDPANRMPPEDLIRATTFTDGLSPLHSAAEVGDADMVRFFMGDNPWSVRLDPELKVTSNMWTPMHFAANSNAYKAAQVLIENGASVTLPDNEGDTPLQLCQTDWEIYPLLLAAKELEFS